MGYNGDMKQLAETITATDAEIILENIHAMIALVEKEGLLISWNRAFEACKKLFPQAKTLGDFFAPDDRDLIISKLNSRAREHWKMRRNPLKGEKLNKEKGLEPPRKDLKVRFIRLRFARIHWLQIY